MKIHMVWAITAVLAILALILGGCKGSKSNQPGLPDVSTINAAPSDTFIVSAASLTAELVTGITPMPGNSSECYHPGAHVVFASTISVESASSLRWTAL